jgi:hypothetical protein
MKKNTSVATRADNMEVRETLTTVPHKPERHQGASNHSPFSLTKKGETSHQGRQVAHTRVVLADVATAPPGGGVVPECANPDNLPGSSQ